MKRISLVSCMLLMVVALVATSTWALEQDEKILHNIASQKSRVDRGVAQGWLSPAAAQTLRAKLDNIQSIYDRAAAEGTLRRQVPKLWEMLGEVNRMTEQEKQAYQNRPH